MYRTDIGGYRNRLNILCAKYTGASNKCKTWRSISSRNRSGSYALRNDRRVPQATVTDHSRLFDLFKSGSRQPHSHRRTS